MPDAFCNYCESHEFLGLCCLCPLLVPLSKEHTFTEAFIYIPVFGCYAGEYVAGCAKNQCGYIGQFQFQFMHKRKASVHILPPPSPIGKNISQDWGPVEDISAQRLVAKVLATLSGEMFTKR